MSELSKQALKVENNQSFPNNNAGLITPSALRTFNEDMIDSTVNQATYTADSASFDARIDQFTEPNTGSLLLTASFAAQNLTFTKGDGSQFSVFIPDDSGSALPSGVVSGSSQINYPDISNIPAGIVSGSSQIILQDTTGLLSGSRIDGVVANSTNSVYSQNTIITGKNIHSVEIPKGTPLYFTGSGTSGNLVGILPADAGNPLRMPAGGVAGETIAVGAEGIVLLDGYIGGVDTSLFASGDEVFVAVGGGYTNQAPTGSALIQHLGNVEKSAVNGSGVIQMMGEVRGLPNIQEGYAWVGDINSVPQPIPTSSFGDGSGFPFSGSAVITGSLSVSETIKSQVYMNPQTLDGFVIPTDNNAMLVGPVAVSGSVVVEGNSNLIVLSQITSSATPLPSGLLSSSVTDFTTYSASVDSRINNISVDTSSLATTGSNVFIGNQTITGSLAISSSLSSSVIVPNTFGVEGLVVDGNMRVQNGSLNVNQAINAGGIYLQTIGRNSNDPINVDNGLNIRPNAPGLAATNVSISGSLILSQSLNVNESITLIGNQTITGSLFLSQSNQGDRGGVVFQVSQDGGPGSRNGVHVDGRLSVNGPADFEASVDIGSIFVSNIYSQTPSPLVIRNSTTMYETPEGGGNNLKMSLSASLEVSGSTTLRNVLNLEALDPLPSGTIGSLAVSGSSLYFYNGAWTLVV